MNSRRPPGRLRSRTFLGLALLLLSVVSGAAGIAQATEGHSASVQLSAPQGAPPTLGALFARASYAGPETYYNTLAVEDADFNMLLSTGAQCIRVDVGYAPWLDGNQTAINEVTSLVQEIRAAGKCLIIADAASETYRNGGQLPWSEFKVAWVSRVSTLAALYHPDYYEVVKEPGWYVPLVSDAATNPQFLNATDWVGLTQNLTNAVSAASPSTRVGVAIGANSLNGVNAGFYVQYLNQVQAIPGISFIGFDVYEPSDQAATQTYLSANPPSKPVWIPEAWSTGDGSPLNGDPNQDAQWMQSVYSFALSIHAAFLIPFYTDDFASYNLTINPPTDSAEILSLYGLRTPVFYAFQSLAGTGSSSTTSSISSESTTTLTTSASRSSSTSSSTTSISSESQSSTASTTSTSSQTQSSSTSPVVAPGNAVIPPSAAPPAFTFAVRLAPASGTLVAGGSTEVTVSVLLLSGNAGPVGLSVEDAPPGVSVALTPVAGTASFVSVMVVNSTSAAVPGLDQLTVVGRSGSQLDYATFQLTVLPAGAQVRYSTVSISSEQGGATDPPTGVYGYQTGWLNVTALPSSGWSFSHWMVNGDPAGNGSVLSFVLNGDVTVKAVFSQVAPDSVPTGSVSFSASGVTNSSVLVDGTSYPLPTSFSWPVGSSHEVSAQGLVPEGNASKLVLVGWGGAEGTSSQTLNFTVKGNTDLVAEYMTEYLVDFAFVDSTGAPAEPQNATISGPGGWLSLSTPNSSAWLEAGASYAFVGAVDRGVEVSQLQGFGNITANSPGSVTIPLTIYPVSIRVVDLFGRPISGANVTLTAAGEQFSQLTGRNGTVTFDAIPRGWFGATYHYLGVAGTLSSSADGAHAETVTMALSYPVLLIGGVTLVVLILARIRSWRRGRAWPSDNPFA
jgi:hypothetical protein